MPRSKGPSLPKGHVAVRLDGPTIERLEALLPLYALPGRLATRSDALRAVILAGLETEERRASRVIIPVAVEEHEERKKPSRADRPSADKRTESRTSKSAGHGKRHSSREGADVTAPGE